MIKPITSVKLKGKRVLLRVGFDVPLVKDKSGHFKVIDDTRIKATLSTINYLVQQKAKIVIISYLGRPDGKWLKEKSLYPAAEKLAELLNRKVLKVSDKLPNYKTASHVFFLTENIESNDFTHLSKDLADGDILFLENLRFYSGEDDNDPAFVSRLVKYGDFFVNDAFSVAHRKLASTVGLASKLPSYASLTLLSEINALNKAIKKPEKPLIVIMGGAKISDKIDTVHFLAEKADKILIGGAIANSFLKAKGYEIGNSKFADISLAKELLRHYKDKIVLPVDLVVAKSQDDPSRAVAPQKVRKNESIFDVGPQTVKLFANHIKTAKTLIWNGPLGLIENKKYAFGSMAIAQAVASRTKGKAYGVVGGGESLEVIAQAKVGEYIDHLSMGGGAMLEFMAGKVLPGIKALE